jgi:hypothetical protein
MSVYITYTKNIISWILCFKYKYCVYTFLIYMHIICVLYIIYNRLNIGIYIIPITRLLYKISFSLWNAVGKTKLFRIYCIDLPSSKTLKHTLLGFFAGTRVWTQGYLLATAWATSPARKHTPNSLEDEINPAHHLQGLTTLIKKPSLFPGSDKCM